MRRGGREIYSFSLPVREPLREPDQRITQRRVENELRLPPQYRLPLAASALGIFRFKNRSLDPSVLVPGKKLNVFQIPTK
jgi:hypothetical protein